MNGRIYYFDKIRILFKEASGTIAKKVNLEELKNNCESAKLLRISGDALAYGFKSKLEITAPNPSALQFLEKSLKGTKLTISYVEIANDILYTTEFVAEQKSEEIIKSIRQKYTRNNFIFDANKEHADAKKRKKKVSNNDELFSDRTCYLGQGTFGSIHYARSSKIAKFPCFHSEFHMQGSNKIKKHFGIASTKDIVNCNCEDSFLKLKNRFTTFEKINHEKHGRFLQNMKRGSINPGIARSGRFAGAHLAEPVRASHLLMRAHDIDASCELRNFYMNKKKEVKEKIKKGGEITALEKKISKLNSNKLNSFFQVIPEPL